LHNAFTVTQGFNTFVTGGPYGGMLILLKVHPSYTDTFYALTSGAGVFISEDTTGHWEPIHDSYSPQQLDFDAQNANVLYLGGDNPLYRSMDNGTNWESLTESFHTGIGCYETFPAAHPALSGYLYFGMGSCPAMPFEPDEGGIYFSTDFGDTWTARNNGLSDLDVQVIAVHPVFTNTLMAGTSHGNIFTSTNGGLNWTLATQLTGTVSRLYFNPHETLEVWAITRTDTDPHAGGEGYLYRSTNLADWETFNMNINPGGPAHAQMAFLPGSVWLASGSVYSTTDSGANWNEIYSPDRGAAAIALSPDNPQVIIIGTDAGIEKSTDGGQSWQEANDGLAALVPYYVAVSPDDPDTVYVKTHHDIFVSHTGGNDWVGLEHSDGTYPGGTRLSVDRFKGTQLYLTAECQGEFCIDTSPDGGATWNIVTSTLPVTYTDKRCGSYTIEPSPHIAGRVLVGAGMTPPDWGTSTGIFYRSDDYGASWSYITMTQIISRINKIAYDAFDAYLIYAGTDGTGLFRSTDGGDNWSHVPVSDTLPPVQIAAIATHPDVPDKVYVRSYSFATTLNPEPELWVSEDAGDTWQPMTYLFLGVDLIVTPPLPGNPKYELYTGCEAGLCRSTNDGQTWVSVAGAPRPEILTAASDGERSVLYLGTPGGLVISAGMQTNSLLDAIPGRGNILGGGVYRLTVQLPTDWLYLPFVVRGYAP